MSAPSSSPTPAPRSGAARLGLDCATPFLHVGVADADGRVLARRSEEVGREHAARLLSLVDEALAEAGIGRADLGGVAVGTGPGSYTGLRVGLAAGLGLARGLGVPLAGAPTLAAMAAGALDEGEEGIVLLDARRGRVYAAAYRREGADVRELAAPRRLPRGEEAALRPGARRIEGAAPDAAWLATRPPAARPPEPIYL